MNQAKYLNGTTSQQVKSTNGTLLGIIVNSHTNGTLKLWDSATAANAVLMNTFTFPSGSGVYMFGDGINFNTALYATVGGTLDYTLLYR